MKKYLLIVIGAAFLASCGQNGDLVKADKKVYSKSEVKTTVDSKMANAEAKSMKLSKDSGLDSKTTKVYTATQPMYDTGMRPTNSK